MLSPQSLSIEAPRRNRITAISSVVQRRPIVLVLGMHRSGTSLCSHLLSALGVDMADDIGVNLGNDKGHWERWEIVESHDRILGLFNRDYWGGFHDFPCRLRGGRIRASPRSDERSSGFSDRGLATAISASRTPARCV